MLSAEKQIKREALKHLRDNNLSLIHILQFPEPANSCSPPFKEFSYKSWTVVFWKQETYQFHMLKRRTGGQPPRRFFLYPFFFALFCDPIHSRYCFRLARIPQSCKGFLLRLLSLAAKQVIKGYVQHLGNRVDFNIRDGPPAIFYPGNRTPAGVNRQQFQPFRQLLLAQSGGNPRLFDPSADDIYMLCIKDSFHG